MAAGTGQAGDIRLCELVFQEGFEPNLMAFFAGSVYEELDDAFTCIFRHEVGKALFGALHPQAQVAEHSEHEGRVVMHQDVEIGKADGEELCVVEQNLRIVSVGIRASQAQFAKQRAGEQYVLQNFATISSESAHFNASTD